MKILGRALVTRSPVEIKNGRIKFLFFLKVSMMIMSIKSQILNSGDLMSNEKVYFKVEAEDQ